MPSGTILLSMKSHAIYEVFHQQKDALLRHLLSEKSELTNGLIILRSREEVHALSSDLQKDGLAVDSVHGKKKQELILRVMSELRAGNISLVVTTDASARNLDLTGVKAIIHMDFPELTEDYQARLSTIESDPDGILYSFVNRQDEAMVKKIEGVLGAEIKRSIAEGFAYDQRADRIVQTRNKTPKRGPKSKPLQHKKKKWKPKKYGRN